MTTISIKTSTLKSLAELISHAENRQKLIHKFPQVFSHSASTAHAPLSALIVVPSPEVDWLKAECQSYLYPSCQSCRLPICGQSNHCQCVANQFYRSEYKQLMANVADVQEAQQRVEVSPFRQFRNAFGFSATIFSAANLILSLAAVTSLVITLPLLIVPPIILGAYVYSRGLREEQETIADMQAEVFDQTIQLLRCHADLVKIRSMPDHANQAVSLFNVNSRSFVSIHHKEKRSLFGNPLSHFIGGALATIGIASVIIHLPVVSGLIIAGPIGWGIGASLALAVGSYFAYKRYQQLSTKMQYDSKAAVLNDRVQEMNQYNHAYIQTHRRRSSTRVCLEQINHSSLQSALPTVSQTEQSVPISTLSLPKNSHEPFPPPVTLHVDSNSNQHSSQRSCHF